MKTNPSIQKAIKIATISGAAILVVKAATTLLGGIKSPKEAIMPVVSILVGLSAFNYAIKANTNILTVTETK